jgi:Predicted N-acetylglucosaminyl transferase
MNIRVLSVVLCGIAACTPREARVMYPLEKAEQWMTQFPDSALAILQTVDPQSLPRGEPRARYALLFTQALDKNYLPISDDSLINRAVKHYKGSSSYRYAAYAHFYRGCAYSQMDSLRLALGDYLEAVNIAKKVKDEGMLGMFLGRLAELYQSQRHIDEAKEAFFLSREAFRRVGDAKGENYMLGQIAYHYRVYYKGALDSAEYYYRQAGEMALARGDTTYVYYTHLGLASVYEAKREYEKAVDILQGAFDNTGERSPEVLFRLSHSYYHLGQLDSAGMYARKILVDSSAFSGGQIAGILLLLSMVEKNRGDYERALAYYQEYSRANSEVVRKTHVFNLLEAEGLYENARLKAEAKNIQLRGIVNMCVLLLLGCTGFLAYVLLVQGWKKRSLQNEKRVKDVLLQRFSIIRELLILSLLDKPRPDIFLSYFDKQVSPFGQNGFFANLESLINECYYGIIAWIREQHPDVSPEDVELVCLLFMGFKSQDLCRLYNVERRGTIHTRCSRVYRRLGIPQHTPMMDFFEEKIDMLRRRQGL